MGVLRSSGEDRGWAEESAGCGCGARVTRQNQSHGGCWPTSGGLAFVLVELPMRYSIEGPPPRAHRDFKHGAGERGALPLDGEAVDHFGHVDSHPW